MDWQTFLEDFCDRVLRLTPEQRAVFLVRLSDAGFEASEAKIAADLGISAAAVKKHMTTIYAESSKVFPQVGRKTGRGKLKELRGCLKEYARQDAPQPPILGEPSQVTVRSSRGLKLGAPMPGVRLPENFVERPEALAAVKGRLLAEDGRTLVVSAIAGLGGLGKSVLATAIVLDGEVQARFEDGILWVTLGQNPDLLGLVGDWIRLLDRSKESLSSTTLEGAKGYLQSLLGARRMLLVIDDVWNAAHAEWFRVGGSGCRVLVTTREAQVEGADYYALDLMTEGEAIALVRGKLGRKWDERQAEAVRRFARVVGFCRWRWICRRIWWRMGWGGGSFRRSLRMSGEEWLRPSLKKSEEEGY